MLQSSVRGYLGRHLTPVMFSGEKQPKIGNYVCLKIALSMWTEYYEEPSCFLFGIFRKV